MSFDFQKMKAAVALAPISVNGTAATTTAVDTAGAGSVAFIVTFGTMGADLDSLKIQEATTSGGSYSDISGATFAAITAAAGAGKAYLCVINMQGGRKRYLKPLIDPGAGATLVSCVALLSDLNQSPNSITERGVNEYLIV